MTENDDLLIRNFFEENPVELSNGKKFNRRVMKSLPRQYGIADRLVPALVAVGALTVGVWWIVSGSWIDAIANVIAGIKYYFTTVRISVGAVLECLATAIIIAIIADCDFLYRYKYHIE